MYQSIYQSLAKFFDICSHAHETWMAILHLTQRFRLYSERYILAEKGPRKRKLEFIRKAAMRKSLSFPSFNYSNLGRRTRSCKKREHSEDLKSKRSSPFQMLQGKHVWTPQRILPIILQPYRTLQSMLEHEKITQLANSSPKNSTEQGCYLK